MNLSLRGLGGKASRGRFEQEIKRQQAKSEAEADAYKAKVAAKLAEVEGLSAETAVLIERVRVAVQDPRLLGDPVLEQVDLILADYEEGLTRIQTSTIAETIGADMNRLALIYTDAQASVVSVTALKSRVIGVLEDLKARVREVQAEQDRLADLKKRQAVLRRQEEALSAAFEQRERGLQADLEAQERRRQQSVAADEALRQRQAEWAQQQREEDLRRARVAEQVRGLDEQIDLERRGLERARSALSRLRMAAQ